MTQIEDNLCRCLRNSTLYIDDTGASKDTQQILDCVTLCVTFYEAGHSAKTQMTQMTQIEDRQ